jgi:hypothetical protein
MFVHDLAVERPEQVVVGVFVADIELPIVTVNPASCVTILEGKGGG